jgi:hypothetical protein
VVCDPIAVAYPLGHAAGEGLCGVFALVRDGRLDSGFDCRVLDLVWRSVGECPAVLAVAEGVDDAVGGLAADTCELRLQEPRH